jgi:plasmid stabilization system protein ParE
MRVIFNSRANREVRSIAEYYTHEAGAKHAQEFLHELAKIVDRIKLWPRSFSAIDTDIHRAVLSKYPFVVVYEIESKESVRILAVRHQKQNPHFRLVS